MPEDLQADPSREIAVLKKDGQQVTLKGGDYELVTHSDSVSFLRGHGQIRLARTGANQGPFDGEIRLADISVISTREKTAYYYILPAATITAIGLVILSRSIQF